MWGGKMSNGRNKRIIVDLDGVVVDSYGQHICDAAKELFDMKIKVEQLCEYSLTESTGLSREQISAIFRKPNYYRDPKPLPHAVETLRKLYDLGYEQHIITARPNDAGTLSDTLRWLADYRVPMDSFHIVANHGDHQATADTKLQIARGMDAAYAVEDNPTNARVYSTICDVVFFVSNRLNSREDMPDNVVRVGDLRDMARYLQEDESWCGLQNSNIKGKAA
jgi:5'(3')-deoxyribonucleotidase